MSEKYVNYYIEMMTATMTDCIVRNVSMQANAKISDDVIKEQSNKIEELVNINKQLGNTIQEMRSVNSASENETIAKLQHDLTVNGNVIASLREEIRNLQAVRIEYDKIKSHAAHIDTFRNELIKSRAEVKNLEAQIAVLTTPTKKKKTVKPKVEPVETETVKEPEEQVITRDGGSF